VTRQSREGVSSIKAIPWEYEAQLNMYWTILQPAGILQLGLEQAQQVQELFVAGCKNSFGVDVDLALLTVSRPSGCSRGESQ